MLRMNLVFHSIFAMMNTVSQQTNAMGGDRSRILIESPLGEVG